MKSQQGNPAHVKSFHRRRPRRFLQTPRCKPFTITTSELNRDFSRSEQFNVFEVYDGQTIDQESTNRLHYLTGQLSLLGRTIAEIAALVEAITNESEQSVRPISTAQFRAHEMIYHLQASGLNQPASDVYSDADGAIRLLWSFQGRNVELVFPCNEADYMYLYHSFQDKYGIEATPSLRVTLDWINWVLTGSQPSSRAAA